MHILFVTHNFYPEVNAPASRTYEHCREWVKSGVKVTVLTCVPNWPLGKVHKGYKNDLIRKDDVGGIKVIRSWVYVAPNKGFLKRIINYLSFMFSSFFASFTAKKPDYVIATSPQFFTIISGYLISRVKRCPFVLEIRDLWPESIAAVGALNNKLVIRVFRFLEVFLYKKAEKIIVVSEAYKKHLIDKRIDEDKIYHIPNGVDFERFFPGNKQNGIRRRYIPEGGFLVSYVGTIGLAHGLDIIIKAGKILKQVQPDVKFLLIGEGARKDVLKLKVENEKLDNIIFVDLVPKEEISFFWNASDISFIHLKKDPLFTKTIPSKLYEAMAHAKPIILGVDGEARKIMEEAGCGIFIDPEDEKQLVEVILKLLKNRDLMDELGDKGHKYVITRCNRKELAKEFLEVIESPSQI